MQALAMSSGVPLTTTTECSAMKNRGVNEAFTEAARVALKVQPAKKEAGSLKSKCVVM